MKIKKKIQKTNEEEEKNKIDELKKNLEKKDEKKNEKNKKNKGENPLEKKADKEKSENQKNFCRMFAIFIKMMSKKIC